VNKAVILAKLLFHAGLFSHKIDYHVLSCCSALVGVAYSSRNCNCDPLHLFTNTEEA
jgi:hypothetical protein